MRLLALLLALPLSQDSPKPYEPQVVVHSFKNAFERHFVSDWQTWVLDLENKLGADAHLTLRVEDTSSHTAVTRRESMPRGSRKRLFFYLPTGAYGAFGMQPTYRIQDASGRSLKEGAASEPLFGQDSGAWQIGLLSSDPSSLNAFALPQSLGQVPLHAVRLSSSTFPGRWAPLSGLDAIVLQDAPLEELDIEQSQALADYVKAGGTVILSPGNDAAWFSHRVLRAFLPLQVGKPEPQTALSTINRRFGKFRGGEPFLVHRLDGPRKTALLEGEALQFDCGYGRAIVLPFDIRRPPFDGWSGMEKLWLDLLGGVPRRSSRFLAGMAAPGRADVRNGIFQSMALLINPYPSFFLLVVLAVLFLAAIGPVNYLVLRKLGMTLLIVVTVPAISIAFLGIVLGIGYLAKGTRTVAYSARFLSTRSGLECARETQLFTLFSPSTRSYVVTQSPGTYGLPHERSADRFEDRQSYGLGYRQRGEPSEESILECEDGSAFAYHGVSVGQWQSWNLEAFAVRGLEGGVRFDVVGDEVKITNRSPYPIERGLYLELGAVAGDTPFGPIAPGETIRVPLRPSLGRGLDDLGVTRESFVGRMLAPTLDQWFLAGRRMSSVPDRAPVRTLLCILKEEPPTVTLDAGLSGDSRSVTVLHVADREGP